MICSSRFHLTLTPALSRFRESAGEGVEQPHIRIRNAYGHRMPNAVPARQIPPEIAPHYHAVLHISRARRHAVANVAALRMSYLRSFARAPCIDDRQEIVDVHDIVAANWRDVGRAILWISACAPCVD